MHHLDVVGGKVPATPSGALGCILALSGLFKANRNMLLKKVRSTTNTNITLCSGSSSGILSMCTWNHNGCLYTVINPFPPFFFVVR